MSNRKYIVRNCEEDVLVKKDILINYNSKVIYIFTLI